MVIKYYMKITCNMQSILLELQKILKFKYKKKKENTNQINLKNSREKENNKEIKLQVEEINFDYLLIQILKHLSLFLLIQNLL